MFKLDNDWFEQLTQRLLDTRFGPVVSVSELFPQIGGLPWYLYTCQLCSLPIGNWFTTFQVGAAGTSTNRKQSQVRAICEAAERYAAMNVDANLRRFRISELEQLEAFPRCAAFERAPKSFKYWPKSELISCVDVQKLSDGEKIPIPFEYVHLNSQKPRDEVQVAEQISTGLAFHSSRTEAIWRGVCEVLERDALMRFWWNKVPLKRIMVDSTAPEDLQNRYAALRRFGTSPYLYDMPTIEGVSAIFCVAKSETYPFLTTGAGCSTLLEDACCKAIDEAVSVRHIAFTNPAFSIPDWSDFDWVNTLEHHTLLYSPGDPHNAFDFLLGSDLEIDFGDRNRAPTIRKPAEFKDLQTTAKNLLELGLTIYWTELESDELRGLGHVAKVVIPEAVPLSISHGNRWLCAHRLQADGSSLESVNRFPHPFA